MFHKYVGWSLVVGLWWLVFGLWSLVVGLWSLVFGGWSLVPIAIGIGLWSLVFGGWSQFARVSPVRARLLTRAERVQNACRRVQSNQAEGPYSVISGLILMPSYFFSTPFL